MPTNVTYTTLISDMQVYLERGGSAVTDKTVYDQLPRLINAAERKLAQDLKLLGQIEVLVDAPAGLQTGNPVLTKPDRWRSTVSMNFGQPTSAAPMAPLNKRTPLFARSYEYCRAYWPDETATSVPRFYSDYDYQHWLIVPTPQQDYPLEILAYMQPPLLDDTNQTNFWTNYTPNALLYGALMEATPFLKDDPRVALWTQAWQQELQTLDTQDLQRIMDRASMRSRV